MRLNLAQMERTQRSSIVLTFHFWRRLTRTTQWTNRWTMEYLCWLRIWDRWIIRSYYWTNPYPWTSTQIWMTRPCLKNLSLPSIGVSTTSMRTGWQSSTRWDCSRSKGSSRARYRPRISRSSSSTWSASSPLGSSPSLAFSPFHSWGGSKTGRFLSSSSSTSLMFRRSKKWSTKGKNSRGNLNQWLEARDRVLRRRISGRRSWIRMLLILEEITRSSLTTLLHRRPLLYRLAISPVVRTRWNRLSTHRVCNQDHLSRRWGLSSKISKAKLLNSHHREEARQSSKPSKHRAKVR